MNICVFGAASNKIEEKYKREISTLCYILGQKGYNLVFGAGSTGLMGAAAEGFKKANSEVIGVIPEFFSNISREPIYTNCNATIITKTLHKRKEKMENLSDAFLIVPGGIGTLDEFFEVLTLKELGQLDKPIILYNFDHFYDGLLYFLNDMLTAKNFANVKIENLFVVCENHNEIFEILK